MIVLDIFFMVEYYNYIITLVIVSTIFTCKMTRIDFIKRSNEFTNTQDNVFGYTRRNGFESGAKC